MTDLERTGHNDAVRWLLDREGSWKDYYRPPANDQCSVSSEAMRCGVCDWCQYKRGWTAGTNQPPRRLRALKGGKA